MDWRLATIAGAVVGLGIAEARRRKKRKKPAKPAKGLTPFPPPLTPGAYTWASYNVEVCYVTPRLVEVVQAALERVFAELGPAVRQPVVRDGSLPNGKTPPGRGHPSGSHDGGKSLDLSYYLVALSPSVACAERLGKWCSGPATQLDVPRQARFFDLLADSGQVKEILVDPEVKKAVVGHASQAAVGLLVTKWGGHLDHLHVKVR